ncbi:hypothetical protein PVAG01_07636 [Phlyctema vagabunda]|uniref:Uncharacterized protein n=1 Tax=Phlyctema vagabunda TaxID=108571 RepID=A0ABR4PDS7_9HELO
MPEVIRGVRSPSSAHSIPPSSPQHDRRVTFENGRVDSSNSTQQHPSDSQLLSNSRRRSSNREREERDAYYDSRAATQQEYQRRASTLQSYYVEHPDLLPQLPFTFRHGFKRWRLAGYIALMVFDACIVPIGLYYAMTFGGHVEGFIVFAVVTAIWGGPTYVEFAVRSLRLIKKEHFYKPLGANQRWAFDITNWILVLTIATVTAILIVGAAPHDVFLRVLSMPGPAILYCICGPIFLLSLYHICGWKAPFRISSTEKGKPVMPGIYYIVEDIVGVNAGGGRPFREGWAARYHASPIFRKMLRDQSWFWSISGLLVAGACTVVVVINPVPEPVAYGIGWGVPFLWAGIWAAITVPWVRAVMHKETVSWEEETGMMESRMTKTIVPPSLGQDPPARKASESSTSAETSVDRTDGHEHSTIPREGEQHTGGVLSDNLTGNETTRTTEETMPK